jgi:hypothetical protein
MNQSTNYFGQHLFSQITFLYNKKILQPVIEKTQANRYYKQLHFYETLYQYVILHTFRM